MAGASGDQIQTRSSAASDLAWRTSRLVGYFCQKSFITTPRPPETSPAKTRPVERLPEPAASQLPLSLVRFSTVKPWALGWIKRKSSHEAHMERVFCICALSSLLLG